jgi:hypothetical protein
VNDIRVETHFVVISSLGVVTKDTERQFRNLLNLRSKNVLNRGIVKGWIKRLIIQAIRGSYEVYNGAAKELRDLEHVVDIVPFTEDLEGEVSNLIHAINEEAGYDNNYLVENKKYINVAEVSGGENEIKVITVEVENEDVVELRENIIKQLEFNEFDSNENELEVEVPQEQMMKLLELKNEESEFEDAEIEIIPSPQQLGSGEGEKMIKILNKRYDSSSTGPFLDPQDQLRQGG